MGVFAERLERYRIMAFSSGFTRVVELNEVLWIQRFLRYGICIIMLSILRNNTNGWPQALPDESTNTYLSQGMMLTKSKTTPVPSLFLAHTGCSNGWNERAQQSKG